MKIYELKQRIDMIHAMNPDMLVTVSMKMKSGTQITYPIEGVKFAVFNGLTAQEPEVHEPPNMIVVEAKGSTAPLYPC